MSKKAPQKTPSGGGAPEGSSRETAGAFSQTPQSSQAPNTQAKLTMVNRLAELRPGTYWSKRLDKPRGWIVVVSRFNDGNVKIRISTMAGRELIQILNVNLQRVQDLIEILNKVVERLPEDAKQVRVQEEEEEW
jgi:hypothetical protein